MRDVFTKGQVIYGVATDPHTFLTAMPTGQLLHLAKDPRLSEDPYIRDRDMMAATVAALRADVQRMFRGAKAKNVESYTQYLLGVNGGDPGLTPPIILWTQDPLTIDDGEARGFSKLVVPFTTQLIAIDGETQLAARFEAAKRRVETLNDRVAVVVCYNRPVEWARQVFHDVNMLGIRPNVAVAVANDARDPMTAIARTLADRVPALKGRVDFTKRQLRKTDDEIVTIATLRQAATTFVFGTPGLQHGMRRSPAVDEARLPQITEAAVDFFAALTEALGDKLADKTQLASSAPTWAAYGALGHEVVDLPVEARDEAIRRILGRLEGVNWSRGAAWNGVAGKVGANDVFALGSPKEVVHQMVKALNEPSDPAFERVRQAA